MGFSKNSGKFVPKNKQKYKGDINDIVYRSNLELYYFRYMDANTNVLEWGSEEVVIPYISPLDNSRHRYYMDLWVRVKTTNGKTAQLLLEIKPHAEQYQPKRPKNGKITQSYKNACATWLVNQAKWEYAKAWAKSRGMTFKVLTERDK